MLKLCACFRSSTVSYSSTQSGSDLSRTSSYSNPFHDPIPPSPPPSHPLLYPTYPDVSLRHLPFYRIEGTLLKPSSLQPNSNARFQEQNFSFHLTPQQASDISSSGYRDDYGK